MRRVVLASFTIIIMNLMLISSTFAFTFPLISKSQIQELAQKIAQNYFPSIQIDYANDAIVLTNKSNRYFYDLQITLEKANLNPEILDKNCEMISVNKALCITANITFEPNSTLSLRTEKGTKVTAFAKNINDEIVVTVSKAIP